MSRIQRWFVTGIVLLAPAYVTGVVLFWLFKSIDGPIRKLVATVTEVEIPGIGVAATALLVLLAGAVASTLFMKNFVRWFEWALQQVPGVRTLYSAIKQLVAPFDEDGSQALNRVVVVEAPDRGLYSLGFLVKAEAAVGPDGVRLSSVLLPSNHLHLGNVVLIPEARIHPVDMTIEEGLKFLVSMGAGLEKPMRFGDVPEGRASA